MRNAPPARTDGAKRRKVRCSNSVLLNASTVNRSATQRPTKHKRAPKKQRARELAIYSGQVYLGTIKLAGKATAFDSNGKRVGTFISLTAAADALGKLGGSA